MTGVVRVAFCEIARSNGDGTLDKRKVKNKSSNVNEIFPCAPSGFFSKVQGDSDPKSKGDPGPVTALGPVVSPGSNFDRRLLWQSAVWNGA